MIIYTLFCLQPGFQTTELVVRRMNIALVTVKSVTVNIHLVFVLIISVKDVWVTIDVSVDFMTPNARENGVPVVLLTKLLAVMVVGVRK